jgi:hypothetical protein
VGHGPVTDLESTTHTRMSGMERPEGLMQDGKLPRRCLLGLRAWPSTVFLTRSQRSENVKLESDCHKVFCAHNFGSHFLLVSTGGGGSK